MKLSCAQALHAVWIVSLLAPSTWAATPTPITQRDINRYAAGLERTRIAILDETGLRRKNEPLSSFVARVALPLAGEPAVAYRMRITQYAARVAEAAEGAAPLRTVPTLLDTDPVNRASWNEAAAALRALPDHVARLKAVVRATDPSKPVDTERVRVELDRTLRSLIAALNGLRDATP